MIAAPLLDYYAVENHAPGDGAHIDNAHLTPLITSEPRKATFVVSYRQGIGYDTAYSQREVDTIWSEAASLGYAPCLKAAEFVTRGLWHALDVATLTGPQPVSLRPPANGANRCTTLKPSRSAERHIVRLTSRHYARLARLGFENRLLADWLTRSRLMVSLFRRSRRYHIRAV